MPIQDKDLILIDNYLLQDLSEADQQYFDQRLADPEFSQALSNQKDILAALKASGRTSVKNKLKNIEQSIQAGENEGSGEKKKNTLLLLLAVILLAALAFFVWKSRQSPVESDPQVFAQFYEPYPNVVTPITMGNPAKDLPADPFRSYEQGDYSAAIAGFEQLDTLQAAADFYLAIAYLAEGEYDSSVEKLMPIAADTNHRYQLAAQWYLALAHLKLNNLPQAKLEIGRIIKAPNHPFQNKASALSKVLE